MSAGFLIWRCKSKGFCAWQPSKSPLETLMVLQRRFQPQPVSRKKLRVVVRGGCQTEGGSARTFESYCSLWLLGRFHSVPGWGYKERPGDWERWIGWENDLYSGRVCRGQWPETLDCNALADQELDMCSTSAVCFDKDAIIGCELEHYQVAAVRDKRAI